MKTRPNSPSPKGAQPSRQTKKILAHVCCGQTAGRIKMSLGTEVGLGPGHTVLDGETHLPLPKGAQLPNFRPVFIVAKRSPISATAEHLFLIFKEDGSAYFGHVAGADSKHSQHHRVIGASLRPSRQWRRPCVRTTWLGD